MPKLPSIVLGISYGHGDSSAALVVDGQLVAAAEEERFTRVKHYALFPTRAIEYCLRHAKLTPAEVHAVAVAKRPSAHLLRRMRLAWQHPGLWFQRRRSHQASDRVSLSKGMRECGLKKAGLVRVEHHMAHLLSARLLSPSDDLALMSFDGLGDFVSATIGRARGNQVEVIDRIFFPHSLGFFYTAMTQFLGFPHFGDEFKVMGLSSYGQPRLVPALRKIVRDQEGFGFELNLEAFPILKEPIRFYVRDAQPVTEPFFNRNLLTQMLGIPPRKPGDAITKAHWDLARSVQVRFEEVANSLLSELFRRVASHNLALAGGCAHNSVWVGKIPAVTQFERIYVAPASHDAGIAVGAAIHAANGEVVLGDAHPALLGPSPEEMEGESRPELPFDIKEQHFLSDAQLIAWLVQELTQKKIVGLMHGRMEFGPRALGSRSILADPRWPDMKDRLNARVKHREPFRPFAASVLVEHQHDWFAGAFHSPTMEAVFDVKPSKRTRIPAVVHVDDSCRIQSISKDKQPFYWALIEAFRQKTGIPMLVNTSFNDSEPIVCTERDAWNCFAHSDLDHLVIGTRAFTKVREMALTG